MAEWIGGALATPGLIWIVLVTFVAGTVYGFAGFGAALVFMPVATVFVAPETAIAAMSITALISVLTVVPQAWERADRAGTMVMIAVATLTIPVGVMLLRLADPALLRWGIIGLAAVTLCALVLGWRRRTPDTVPARVAVAAASGVAGGAVGLNGPVFVLFQLSGTGSAERTRANAIIFLTTTGVLVLPALAMQGLIAREALALGVLLLLPYGLGTLAGRALFDPVREQIYRRAAYGIIGAAILLGLPIWA